MKTLKQTLFLGLMALMVIPTFNSCKKGEDDPTSLRSRKARLTGEWNLESAEYKSTNTNEPSGGSKSTNVTDHTFTGGNYTQYETSTTTLGGLSFVDRDTATGSMSETLTFEKDGTFKRIQTKEFTEVETFDNAFNKEVTTTVTKEIMEISGTWDFNDGIGDNKSKEMVLLFMNEGKTTEDVKETVVKTDKGNNQTTTENNTSLSTMSFTGSLYNDVQIINLSRLANDEMISEQTVSYSSNEKVVYTDNSGSSNYEGKYTMEMSGSMTYIKNK